MAALYSQLQQNTALTDSDIRGLLGKYGMTQRGRVWIYMPTEVAKEVTGKIPPGETPKEQSIWSKVWQTIKGVGAGTLEILKQKAGLK